MNICYNHIVLIGRLTKDSELQETPNAKKATLRLAVDRPYKNGDGSTETDFFNVVFWGKRADVAGNFLKKGRLILIEGRLQIRPYEVDGIRKFITEVIADNFRFLEPRRKETMEDLAFEAS